MGSGVRKHKNIKKNPIGGLAVWNIKDNHIYAYNLKSIKDYKSLIRQGVIYRTGEIRYPDRFVEWSMKKYWKTYNNNHRKNGSFPVYGIGKFPV